MASPQRARRLKKAARQGTLAAAMTGPHQKKPDAGSPRSPAACVGAVLIIAFLAASLAPCPPRARAQAAHAAHASRDSRADPASLSHHAEECHVRTAQVFLTAPCPCGCAEHLPIAGSSARLGVALPSVAPGLAPRLVAALAGFAPPLFEGSFTPPIDHIPLPA